MIATEHEDDEIAGTPEYWAWLLVRSLRKGDLVTAAEAQGELHDMGLDVRIVNLLASRRQEVAHA